MENRIIKQNVHKPFGAEHTLEKDHMIHVILLKHIMMKVVIILLKRFQNRTINIVPVSDLR